MAIATPTKNFTVEPIRGGNWLLTVNLTGASQVAVAEIFDLSIDTVHIYGAFNSQNVSLLGFNANYNDSTEAAAATAQVLHRADAPSSTFSAVAAELLAGIIEQPRYVIAVSNGAVTNVRVVICAVDRKARY